MDHLLLFLSFLNSLLRQQVPLRPRRRLPQTDSPRRLRKLVLQEEEEGSSLLSEDQEPNRLPHHRRIGLISPTLEELVILLQPLPTRRYRFLLLLLLCSTTEEEKRVEARVDLGDISNRIDLLLMLVLEVNRRAAFPPFPAFSQTDIFRNEIYNRNSIPSLLSPTLYPSSLSLSLLRLFLLSKPHERPSHSSRNTQTLSSTFHTFLAVFLSWSFSCFVFSLFAMDNRVLIPLLALARDFDSSALDGPPALRSVRPRKADALQSLLSSASSPSPLPTRSTRSCIINFQRYVQSPIHATTSELCLAPHATLPAISTLRFLPPSLTDSTITPTAPPPPRQQQEQP